MNSHTRKRLALALAAPLVGVWPALAGAQESTSSQSSASVDQNGTTTRQQTRTRIHKKGTGGSGTAGTTTTRVRQKRPGTVSQGGPSGAESTAPSTGYVSPPVGQRGTGEVAWPGNQTLRERSGKLPAPAPQTGSADDTAHTTGSGNDTGSSSSGGGQ